MKFTPTKLPGVVIIDPDVYRDDRGFFLETFHEKKYRAGGIPATFVQDNHSSSVKGTLRGLHFQCTKPQGKLIRVISGEILDVAVDIRRGSPTYLQWVAEVLTAENFRQIYVPPRLAHGFLVVSERAEVEYKCTDFYNAPDEGAVIWNEPEIGVRWPVEKPVLSAKDQRAPRLKDVVDTLPIFDPAVDWPRVS